MAGSAAAASRRKRLSSELDAHAQPSKRAKKAASPTTIVISRGTHLEQVAEVQSARCNTARYKQRSIPQCFACVRRRGGDTCRFQNVRVFIADDGAPAPTCITYIRANEVYEDYIASRRPQLDFPRAWNEPLSDAHVTRVKTTIATAMLPVLKQELAHLAREDVAWRALEHDVRATCDTCLTSIFSGAWMCRICGREVCGDCYERIVQFPPPTTGAPSDEHKSLLACMRSTYHSASRFIATSRFTRPQLQAVVTEMEALLRATPIECILRHDASPLDMLASIAANSPPLAVHKPLPPSSPGSVASSSDTSLLTPINATPPPDPTGKPSSPLVAGDDGPLAPPSPLQIRSSPPITVTAAAFAAAAAADAATVAAAPTPPAPTPPRAIPSGCERDRVGIPCYRPQMFADGELTDDVFADVWAKGLPIVVTGQLAKFRLEWTPEYFIRKHGAEPCQLVECQSETIRSASVADFFRMFRTNGDGGGNGTNGSSSSSSSSSSSVRADGRVWKLKDWPPSTDFAVQFPELYRDFSNAVPAPAYARRDGALNIASHFPRNTVWPDLGPKMYNALATDEREGSMGSTRLHMDIADAVNVMMYAALPPGSNDTHPPCAAWDLFRAEDSDKIRAFLRDRFELAPGDDPIHTQRFYLDSELRRALWEEKSVLSYRVYQTPGDAVFIPAGCAHQVSNLADCIKVAVDFVSPENIARCAALTEEFRRLNLPQVWKEDVLQLRAMMWYAWMSCARPSAERSDGDDGDVVAKAAIGIERRAKVEEEDVYPAVVEQRAALVQAEQSQAEQTQPSLAVDDAPAPVAPDVLAGIMPAAQVSSQNASAPSAETEDVVMMDQLSSPLSSPPSDI